jgi:hypothetical protein
MLENATKNSSHLVVQKKKVKKGRKKKKPVVPGLFYSQYIAIKNNNHGCTRIYNIIIM